MTQPTSDAKAVVRALDALTTQARRIADALTTPVVQHVVTTDDAETTPATTCSAQHHGFPGDHRHCIRAAHHHGDHIDEHGYHWSDTVAVYPVIDGVVKQAHLVPAEAYATWTGQTPAADEPEAACRVMDTRTCPPTYNGPCGDRPCARFESDDPTPWLDTAPAAEPPADDADPAPNLLHVLVDRAARGVLTEGEAATFRRRVEQLVNGRATWKAKGEEMERDRDRLAAELTRSENARDHLRCRADAAEAEAERLRDLVIAENKRADDAINREDTADSAAEEQRGRAAAAEAAIERVRALVAGIAHPTSAGITQYDLGRKEMATAVVLAITEQPTTEQPEPLRVTPCTPPRMAVHCGGQCLAIAPSDHGQDRRDIVFLEGDSITCLTGTPGGPVPSTPPGAHYLAEVYVPRGTAEITAAHVTSSGLLFYRPTTEA
ncbi:hypothetical protein [Streptomyces asoensis]|uniref:Uncharacterized protein n=1 Tax=Streptomyces asoensis TaxID=249586 RepID=A0ABQ3RZ21_9ACTN|nr:hypothetical protein [Streptomyces asoensis]GGQ48651.1 hypothetical protein GCM10010496_08650 [Streptomyces asoensis]GHI61057.1 hypothetical protein Saso_27070 [Streptomyces asoensis]